ncbi:hypothetical protein CA12_03550 [Alienimonas californiensis]|uniref:Uncharacterized protein n=1 Tax=Alienimonas californiensis TaxID=2527989 RepID=A0A517P4H6_9PLAN|nr:hypothetical protein CA12_03550 [Alienimonas californiensis]
MAITDGRQDLGRRERLVPGAFDDRRATADTARFAAHVLTYGGEADLAALREQLPTVADLRAVLDAAPAGVYDARSWAYWNLMAGRDDPPPPPARTLPS